MSIGKVSVSRPLSTPKAASLETSKAEARSTPVSARADGSSFEAAPAGRPMVDLQGGALGLKGGVNEASDVEGTKEAQEIQELTRKLETYGISLSGDWSDVGELRLLRNTVSRMDAKLRGMMREAGQTGFAKGELFQRLFGQVTFERVAQDELAPGKYAEQKDYNAQTGTSTISVSDKAFTVTTGNERDLKPAELLGHELAHIINRRFLSSDGQYFGNTTLNSPPNESLGFAARTNTSGPEWVADVFANALMGKLNTDTPEQADFAQRVEDALVYVLGDDATMR